MRSQGKARPPVDPPPHLALRAGVAVQLLLVTVLPRASLDAAHRMAMDGDAGARVALAVTALFMWLLRKPLPSVIAGMLSAALVRLTLA